MKFKHIFFLASAIAIAGCSDTTQEGTSVETPELAKNFVVEGKVQDAANMSVYVETMTQNGALVVDKGLTDANGNFRINGNIPDLGMYQLRVGESQEIAIPLTIAPNDSLHIESHLATFALQTKVSGVDWGSAYSEYMELFTEFANNQQQLQALQASGTLSQESLMAEYMKMKAPIDDYAKEHILKHPASPLNLILYPSIMPAGGFDNYSEEHLNAFKIMVTAYEKEHANSPITKQMTMQLGQLENAYNEYQLLKSGQKVAPEIALLSPEGKEIKLSSLKGKVVLIDFWASWCGPCRRENPNVVRLYNEYKDKGFTIYSVSLDTDSQKWQQAIAMDGLIWPNHVSDLKGWETPLTAIYGFNSIPHTVLIDREGKIIEIGLRGASLEQKLKEILSK